MRLLLLETGLYIIALFPELQGHMAAYKMPLSNFLNDEADRGIGLDEAALQQRQALFERAIDNVCLQQCSYHTFFQSQCCANL